MNGKRLQLIFIISCLYPFAKGCIYPTGLEILDVSSVPSDGIFALNIAETIPFVLEYETPIQFRLIEMVTISFYSAMSSFEEYSLDFFGRIKESNDRRRCQDAQDFDIQRRVTLAYLFYYSMPTFFPNSQDKIEALLESFGLDSHVCEKKDCSDVSTPYGLAYVLTQEVYQFSLYDGWNSDGSLSRDFNKIPYQDFRTSNKYIPENCPWELKNTDKWKPLLESDQLGFLFFQEHVVPHVGFTGKSIVFNDEQICSFNAPNPEYNYSIEMELAIQRLADLNDYKKVEIEYFDGKLTSIVPLLIQYYSRLNISLDSFEFITINAIIDTVLYESVLIVWKEKIRYNAVRPTSIIQTLLAGTKIKSYAGTNSNGKPFGTKIFNADDWEAYIRTMPHAEYPSASACFCEAFAQTIIKITGSDDVTVDLGGPLIELIQSKSSIREPGYTPNEDINLIYSSWSEISKKCGISRLNGGMHFTASVPAGEQLCKDIGSVVIDTINDLINGKVPKNIVDFNDKTIPNRRCDEYTPSPTEEPTEEPSNA